MSYYMLEIKLFYSILSYLIVVIRTPIVHCWWHVVYYITILYDYVVYCVNIITFVFRFW